MKIANRILIILILVSAITAGIFSIFLFKKREKMIQGWQKMAETIQKTAKILDQQSGTKLASSLTPEKLEHRLELDELQSNLAKLTKGAEAVITQRDSLADALVKTAANAEYNQVKAVNLKTIATSAQEQNKAANGVLAIRKRNDAILGQYISIGNILGERGFSAASIKNGQANAFYNRLANAVRERDRRIAVFQGGLRNIAAIVDNRPVLRGKDYQGWTNAVHNGVKQQRAKLVDANNRLKAERVKCAQRDATIRQLREAINSNKMTIADLQKKSRELHLRLNPAKNKDLDKELFSPKTVQDFCKYYQMVRGRISHVDKAWGFVLIDIGTPYKLTRKVAGREFVNYLNIPEGEYMTVVRGLDTKNSKFIGKIHLSEVFPTYAVADISRKSAEEIQPGDFVIFLPEDAKKLIKNPKSTTKTVR